MRIVSTIVAAAIAFVLQQQPSYTPARYRLGDAPVVPNMTVGGGEVVLDVTVDRFGHVTSIAPLRSTPPFTELVSAAVRSWEFDPAEDLLMSADGSREPRRVAVASHVVVTGVFRAPALYGPTLGEVPMDLSAPASGRVFPLHVVAPPYPPSAVSSGIVLLEALVDADGTPGEIAVVRSSPPFDEPARAALAGWRFRPELAGGAPISTYTYVLIGFPTPVLSPEPPKKP